MHTLFKYKYGKKPTNARNRKYARTTNNQMQAKQSEKKKKLNVLDKIV